MTISQNHALVCIEDLQVKKMSKSAKGNSEQPGRNVRQKCDLNRSIFDQGWAEFRRQLAHRRAAAEHEPDVPVRQPCIGEESANTSNIFVCRVRLRQSRRCGWRDQCFRAGDTAC